jgi:bacteriocin leader peptide (microcyclamide/patellamide family)
MDKQNLMPQVAQPVNRTTTGQLPAELTELSEEALQLYGEGDRSSASVLPLLSCGKCCFCVVCSNDDDGDDAE